MRREERITTTTTTQTTKTFDSSLLNAMSEERDLARKLIGAVGTWFLFERDVLRKRPVPGDGSRFGLWRERRRGRMRQGR